MTIKLKSLLPEWISHGIATNRNPDVKLRATPGGQDDGAEGWNENVGDWDGVIKGNSDWWGYVAGNDWNKKQAGVDIYITEDDKPHKISIKIKTHGLRKNGDTNESYKERVRKHAHKVARSWMSKAKEIHNNTELNEVGNPISVSWKHAFKEALSDPKVQGLVAEVKEKELSPISDPVNFTPRIRETNVMKSQKISYSAVVLTDADQEKVKSIFKDQLPDGWTIFAHHMTICMGPLQESQKADIGKKVTLTATDLGKSLTNVALKVNGYTTTNATPHITLAVNVGAGGKPVDSNKITNWTTLSQQISLEGVVTEIPSKQ